MFRSSEIDIGFFRFKGQLLAVMAEQLPLKLKPGRLVLDRSNLGAHGIERVSDTVEVDEAKAHLSRLLEEVAKGRTITITRHGVPVAKLVPVTEPRMSVAEAIEKLREVRKGSSLGGLTIRELIDEGRRY